jgi:hypothetical protein
MHAAACGLAWTLRLKVRLISLGVSTSRISGGSNKADLKWNAVSGQVAYSLETTQAPLIARSPSRAAAAHSKTRLGIPRARVCAAGVGRDDAIEDQFGDHSPCILVSLRKCFLRE